MNTWEDFRRGIAKPMVFMIQSKNTPRVLLSAIIVACTCVFNAAAAPLANALFGDSGIVFHYTIWQRLGVLAASACSIMLACLVLKLLAAIYKKDVSFKRIFATWGINFVPTIIAIAIVETSEAGFYAFMVHTWLAVAMSTLLVLLVAWKIIYFFMEVRLVLGLKGSQTAWAAVITAVAYLVIMVVSGRLGLTMPVL